MRHPADEDICPLLPKLMRIDRQMGVCRPYRKLSTESSSADGQTEDRGEHAALSPGVSKQQDEGGAIQICL